MILVEFLDLKFLCKFAVGSWELQSTTLGYGAGELSRTENRGTKYMLRITRFACGPTLPAAVLLIGVYAMGTSGASAQASQETRDACTGDAMQFCSEFVPDVPKVTKCMMAKRRILSKACQIAMANEHKARRRAGQHCAHGHNC